MDSDQHIILAQFQIEGNITHVQPFGMGHINDTFLVKISRENGRSRRLILQRLNRHVFPEPEKVMANIDKVTAHLKQKILQLGGDPDRETLTFLQTRNGRTFYKTTSGDYWRLALFIDGAQTYQHAPTLNHYYEAAQAYGRFQAMLSDFPADQLHETIPHFHDTEKRLADLETAIVQDTARRAKQVQVEIDFIRQRSEMASTLTHLQNTVQIPLRVTHNDTKLDNVMIDSQTGKGICVIDLDTVMPGIALFDFADAVRSGTNLAAEDEVDTNKVTFDLAIFEQIARGFLHATHHCLNQIELKHLTFASRLITYEQAIRFLTDYLSGDIYYKTHHAQQNLYRTRTQIKLLQLMEDSHPKMANIIQGHL